MRTPTAVTVSQLNFYVKTLLEGEPALNSLCVCGEISNFTNHYKTGHLYFTLKDSTAAIKTVMFRSSAERLRFTPENGMKVIIRGRVSVYERDGQYQLYCDDMQPDGVGALAIAFDQLKKKLEAEGLFDSAHKKALPTLPMNVGVITSPTGAAVRDIINVLGRRFPLAEVTVFPVLVQGDGAAPQLSAALSWLNSDNCQKKPDIIIIGRGGGSIEDLWAFNEECVARAVFSSDIPVISAVGHETDFTICDFVADLRAPTPSAAAELAVPDFTELLAFSQTAPSRCAMLIKRTLERQRAEHNALCSSRPLKKPTEIVDLKRIELDSLISAAAAASHSAVDRFKLNFAEQCSKLDALSPFKVLSRGYALITTDKGCLTAVDGVAAGDSVQVRLQDGVLNCEVMNIKKIGCAENG